MKPLLILHDYSIKEYLAFTFPTTVGLVFVFLYRLYFSNSLLDTECILTSQGSY